MIEAIASRSVTQMSSVRSEAQAPALYLTSNKKLSTGFHCLKGRFIVYAMFTIINSSNHSHYMTPNINSVNWFWCEMKHLLLVNPVVGGLLVADDLALGEPEGNLLLGVLNGVRTVADVAADILVMIIRTIMATTKHCVNELTRAKSPRMVPGAEAKGLVAPRRTRPVLTASRPSQTMAQIGPEFMSDVTLGI